MFRAYTCVLNCFFLVCPQRAPWCSRIAPWVVSRVTSPTSSSSCSCSSVITSSRDLYLAPRDSVQSKRAAKTCVWYHKRKACQGMGTGRENVGRKPGERSILVMSGPQTASSVNVICVKNHWVSALGVDWDEGGLQLVNRAAKCQC